VKHRAWEDGNAGIGAWGMVRLPVIPVKASSLPGAGYKRVPGRMLTTQRCAKMFWRRGI
jgi:hypothetical protein